MSSTWKIFARLLNGFLKNYPFSDKVVISYIVLYTGQQHLANFLWINFLTVKIMGTDDTPFPKK